MKSNVLVTGGAGFIGRAIIEATADRFACTSVDVQRFQGVAGRAQFQMLVQDTPLEVFQGQDVVIHLAASTDTRTAISNARADYKSADATLSVLEGMRDGGIRDIIFASSGAVYGEKLRGESDEADRCSPISLYGASKLYCEGLIRSFCELHGMRAVILRLANVVGAQRQQGVIWDFVNQAHLLGRPIAVLGNGKQTKSYVHIDDVVEAFRLARSFLADMAPGSAHVFNVAGLGCVSALEIAHWVLPDGPITTGPEDQARGWPGDVPRTVMSDTRFGLFGFHPQFSSSGAVQRVIREMREK